MMMDRWTFNSFEDETSSNLSMWHPTMFTFNSFEDETLFENSPFTNKQIIFQFLWGWNGTSWERMLSRQVRRLSIPLRMKRASTTESGATPFSSFNSFEDEARSTQQVCRVKITLSFNSFEDETILMRKRRDMQTFAYLSIPLRMKRWSKIVIYFSHWPFNSFEDETKYGQVQKISLSYHFQFLWGWNVEEITEKRIKKINDFQFLWGWNWYGGARCSDHLLNSFQFLWGWNTSKVGLEKDYYTTPLSIPLRMKHATPSRSSWKSSSFNSFEDETLFAVQHALCNDSTFNSFEDETCPRVGIMKNWTLISFNSFEDETKLESRKEEH